MIEIFYECEDSDIENSADDTKPYPNACDTDRTRLITFLLGLKKIVRRSALKNSIYCQVQKH